MTYARPFIARTNGQQPHVSAQYVAASSISLSRLAASLPPRIATTLGSPPSFTNRRTNFALAHNATGTPSVAPPGRTDIIKMGNSDACKAKFSPVGRVPHSNRPGVPLAYAVAPSVGSYQPGRGRRVPIPQQEKAALHGPSFCCFTVSGRAPFQGAGNLIGLPEGLGFTSPGRLRKPVSPPIHHLPCREIHGDDLGHVVILQPVAALVERHPVQQQ